MASVDVIKSCLDSLQHISEYIEDAVLYLDAGCAEAFQFQGAFPLLLELGVRALCSLENSSPLDTVVDWSSHLKHAKKMVVITSRLLSDAHRYILRCLSTQQTILHCAIFTSISEMAHSACTDSPLGPDAFREYESLLLQDYEELVKKVRKKEHNSSGHGESSLLEKSNFNERLTSKDEGWSQLNMIEEGATHSKASDSGRDIDATHSKASDSGRDIDEAKLSYKKDGLVRLVISVHHFPMVLCPLSPRVFVLPSEGTVPESCLSNELPESVSPGLPPISAGVVFDDDTPPGAALTAHFLYHLAAEMDLKMEIFSLGDLSKTIGKILMDMSSLYDVGRRKRSAGLLLVDRTLDLITPCCHGDTLLDRMFSSLARRERTSPSRLIQNRHGFTSLQVPPLNVQIPLGQFINGKERTADDFLLLERIEAFECGWKSSNTGSRLDWTDPHNRIYSDSSIIPDGLLNGSFVSTEHYKGTKYLEALLDRRTKDGALLIKKWLQEALSQEKLSNNLKTRAGFATAAELHSLVRTLAKDESSIVRNRGIIQLGAAAAITLSEPHSSRWDAFLSAERILRASAVGDTSQNLSAQIRDLINKSVMVKAHEQNVKMESSQGLLSFQDALLLAMIGYILAGENFPTSGSGSPFSWEEEHFLKETIVDAILENPGAAQLKFLCGLEKELEANVNNIKSERHKEGPSNESTIDDFDDDHWGNWGDEDIDQNNEQEYGDMQLKLELRDRVDNLFKFFHKLSSLKRRNTTSREGSLGLDSKFDVDTYMGRGLLYKILTTVLAKYEISGLEYHSSTVGRLFKSGFGRFGLGQAKPSLSDHDVMLIFVVGGINIHEVFEIHEALSQSGRPDIELVIGGTTLLTPAYMFELLLGSSSYV